MAKKAFKIVSPQGVYMGVYRGRNRMEAMRNMHREAGYYRDRDLEEVLKKPIKEIFEELTILEVPDYSKKGVTV